MKWNRDTPPRLLGPPLVCIAPQKCLAVKASAVQCSEGQCSAVQCSAVQSSAVQCSAVSEVQCSASHAESPLPLVDPLLFLPSSPVCPIALYPGQRKKIAAGFPVQAQFRTPANLSVEISCRFSAHNGSQIFAHLGWACAPTLQDDSCKEGVCWQCKDGAV